MREAQEREAMGFYKNLYCFSKKKKKKRNEKKEAQKLIKKTENIAQSLS